MTSATQPNRPIDPDDAEVDLDHLKNVMGLCVRSPRRHPTLAALIMLAGIGLGLLAAAMTPKIYVSEASLLVQRNLALDNLAGPRSNNNSQDNEPLRGVHEQILRRDNLQALVRSAHLAERMSQPKTGLRKFKDTVLHPFSSHVVDPAGLEETAVTLLEKSLTIRGEGSTFTITAQWWEPETAFELVKLAQKSFLDGRNAAEVSIISDGIAVLEDHAKAERDAVDEALRQFDEAKRTYQQGGKNGVPLIPSALPSRTPTMRLLAAPSARPDATRAAQDTTRLIEEKHRQIREIEDDRNRRLAELRSQLAGLVAMYTPAHPSVVSVQSKIDALSSETAAERTLKAEERQLMQQITAATTAAPSRVFGAPSVPTARVLSGENIAVVAPQANMALAALQTRVRKYEELMDRISAARLDLDIATKAFKYRYSVFKPAEMPKEPVKSRRVLSMVAGIVLGLFGGMLAAVFADLLSGRIIESWQAGKKLGIRVLGEVNEP